MSAIERLERANPVPDEDRLLAAPGAMDAFVSSVKERSGIVKKTERKGSGVEDRPPIEVPTDAAPIEGSRRRFGLVAAAAVVVLVIGAAAAFLTLSGDGGDDVVTASPATSGPITSFDDIAGTTYERQGVSAPGYFHFFEDGTYHFSSNPDLVEDRPSIIAETRFEGTQVFLNQSKGPCVDEDAIADAIYEIHLLENDNLKFFAMEDTCLLRSGGIQGVDWVPVP